MVTEHDLPLESGAIALATETLQSFGQLRLRAFGASMLPTLRPGDVLQFESCTAEQTEPGDIVIFRRAGKLVIHRVLARTSTSLLTQGDGLLRPDPPVECANVLGRMVGLSRSGRALSHQRPSRIGDHLIRWLFRRFNLTTSLFLRWQGLSIRSAA